MGGFHYSIKTRSLIRAKDTKAPHSPRGNRDGRTGERKKKESEREIMGTKPGQKAGAGLSMPGEKELEIFGHSPML